MSKSYSSTVSKKTNTWQPNLTQIRKMVYDIEKTVNLFEFTHCLPYETEAWKNYLKSFKNYEEDLQKYSRDMINYNYNMSNYKSGRNTKVPKQPVHPVLAVPPKPNLSYCSNLRNIKSYEYKRPGMYQNAGKSGNPYQARNLSKQSDMEKVSDTSDEDNFSVNSDEEDFGDFGDFEELEEVEKLPGTSVYMVSGYDIPDDYFEG